MQAISIEADSHYFATINKACQHLPVSKYTIYTYAKTHSLAVKDVIKQILTTDNVAFLSQYSVKLDNVTYASLTEGCSQLDIPMSSLQTIRTREQLSSWQEALDFYRYGRGYLIQGKRFAHVKEACAYFGVAYRSVANASHLDQISLLDSLYGHMDKTYPLKRQELQVGAITFPSLPKVAKWFHLPLSPLRTASKKHTLTDAVLALIPKYLPTALVAVTNALTAAGVDWLDVWVKKGIAPVHQQAVRAQPKIDAHPVYVQQHTFPNAQVAALYFGVCYTEVCALITADTYSPAGAIFSLIHEKGK